MAPNFTYLQDNGEIWEILDKQKPSKECNYILYRESHIATVSNVDITKAIIRRTNGLYNGLK